MLKPSFYVVLFLFSAVVSSRQAVAQNLPLDYQLPLAKIYSVENGLSQVTVSDIAQDKDGYIWLATQSGIDRFDGYDFIHYGQSDDPSKGLSSAFVYAIEIDPSSGDLWIGTLNGLNVMRAKTRRFEQLELPNDFDDNDKTIHSIHIDEGGSIFVGTQKGLYAKYAGENEFLRLSPQAEIITVEDIAEHDEQLFIATSAGLYSLDKMSRRFSLALLEEQNVESVFVDNQSHLWIGTIGDGLYRAKLTNDGFSNLVNLSVEEGFTNNLINDIYQVRDNSIWVATTNGLSIFPDPNKLDFVTFFESSSNSKDTLQSHIHTLFSTDNGLVFLGTNGNGVGVIDQNKNMFKRFVLDNTQHHFSIAPKENDVNWLVAETGIWILNPDNSVSGPLIDEARSQKTNKVMSVAYDKSTRTLWIATRLGLARYQDGDEFIESVDLKNKELYTLELAPTGVWVGTTKHGLYFYDFETQSTTMHFNTPMVIDIVYSSEEELIVGTTNGLFLINPQSRQVRVITEDKNNPNGIAHNVITWVSKVSASRYYVGLHAHGLMLMELDDFQTAPVFTQLFKDSELSASSIGAVVEDEQGLLWISTERGIARGDLKTQKLDYFGQNDGTNESGYYIGAGAKNSDDKILFAGDQGLTYFYPESISKNEEMPSLHITKIGKLSSEDNYGASTYVDENNNFTRVTLRPEDLLLTIDFAALEYGSPESIEYAYRLLGFDSRWQYLDSRNRTITYTNLDPGNYQLEIKSTNRYGLWSDTPRFVDIQVLPPWWQTPIAVLLIGILVFLLLFGIFRWRTYALHKRSEELLLSVKSKTQALQLANERLKVLTTLDPLTEVYNRRGFTENLSREFSRYQREQVPFSIILIDIDFFKKVNDNYGHESGDIVLKEIADVLRQSTRSYDMLARWGGEEFIALLPNTKLPEAILLANKYRETIAEHVFAVKQGETSITLTAGVASIEEHKSADDCISQADRLLYEGKNMGRNQVLPML